MLVGIFTTGRSGSTLLTRLLDGSPDLWIHPVELNYLSVFSDLARWGRVRNHTRANATTQRLALWHAVSSELLRREFGGQIEEIRQTYGPRLAEPLAFDEAPLAALWRCRAYAASEFLPSFLEAVQQACDAGGCSAAPHYVFKTIETPYVDEYLQVFPEMRCIHLIRHPLTTYASSKRTLALQKRRPFWYLGGDDLRTLIEMRWLPHARYIVEECTQAPQRHYVMTYEALCERPVVVLGQLCEWLGVRPPPDPTLQTVLGGLQMAELPASSSQRGVQTPARVVSDMTRRFAYDHVVTEREEAFITFRTQRWMRALGYEPTEPMQVRMPRWHLAKRWILPDRWELMNVRSWLRLIIALLQRRCYIFSHLVR